MTSAKLYQGDLAEALVNDHGEKYFPLIDIGANLADPSFDQVGIFQTGSLLFKADMAICACLVIPIDGIVGSASSHPEGTEGRSYSHSHHRELFKIHPQSSRDLQQLRASSVLHCWSPPA
jgi:hypothetical protein